MSFDQREKSRTQGAPFFLYFFRYGDTPDAFFAYTNADDAIEHIFDDELGPVLFVPEAISHGSIQVSGTLDRATLEVRTPQDSEISLLFRHYPPSQVVSMLVFQAHEDEPEIKVVWAGRALGNQLEEDEAVFTCEPVSTSQKRAGLRRHWGYGCPHVLYSVGDYLCNANKAAATITAPVTLVQGALVTMPGAWAPTGLKAKYLGGLASWTRADGRTETRSIIRLADSDTIILSGLALGLTSGMAIDLSYGCDHVWDSDCSNLHNNVLNFGGQPLIPTKNPIGIVNNFY